MSTPPITVAQARAIDRDAVERLGMPSLLLMENAARAVADRARSMMAAAGTDAVVWLCGAGNNGGDGLAAARLLGPGCAVHLLAEPDRARAPDAACQLAILRAAEWPVRVGSPPEPDDHRGALWVDALFGTGLSRPLEGAAAEWVERFNRALGPKLCVDVPSGLDGDSGEPLGPVCRGDATVTFAAAKVGLIRPEAAAFVGELHVAPLGIPSAWPSAPSSSVAADLDGERG